MDTSSAFDLENYGYAEEADTIRGLGTADMKGSCAAGTKPILLGPGRLEKAHTPDIRFHSSR